ncbi:trans-sulfuration enzyme family protein [Hyphococcus sp.]|uniref:trans-sulfuration enzyme family protein n=1 Tax=Hyphococcus sp. TaxID=2038636 RepID=UPI0035C66CE9
MIAIDPQDRLICLRAGEAADDHHGAVLPQISQASLYRKRTMEDLLDGLSREHAANVYSRGTNPTVKVLEDTLANLERAEACKCFGSGMGAVSAVLFGLLKSGDHVLFVNDIYGPTLELAARLENFGVSWSQSFAQDVDVIAGEMRDNTRLIYMESPGSMLFRLLPIAEIRAMAKTRNALTVIDNTVATPLLQKPLALGADLSLHSCSKYIGGHSDVIGGAVMGSQEFIERLFYKSYMLLGSVLAPFDAFLLLRGLMTLPDRMARHHEDALTVANYLENHPRIGAIYHPAFCKEDSALFEHQMRGHSGLFSVALKDTSYSETLAVADRLKLFGRAVSWGGAESLVLCGHKSDPAGRETRIPATLLRFSIGLEGADNLIADLEQALA